MPPAPYPRMDGAAGRSTDSARHPTPRLSASPSLGVDGSPWLLREGGSQSIPLPANPMLSTVAPSWASAVRDGTCSGNPPAASQKDDFFCLYKRCVASGLRARVEIRNCSGFQEITLSCRLQATPHAIGASRAHRGSEYPLPEYPLPEPPQPEHPPASPPMPTRPKSLTALHKQAVPEQPPPMPLRPEHSPDFSSNPSPSPPPAKQTRKAARRQCRAKLLRDGGEEEALVLSPLNTTPPSPALTTRPPSPPPSPSPTSLSPSPEQLSPLAHEQLSPLAPPSPAGLPLLAPPSPSATPAINNTPPSSRGSPPTPTRTTADLSLGAPPATGPPTPPPWPEAYVFPADPDRIMCPKCCNRHYNYRWYSQCFMCNGK
jgi:hypothetical protein